MRVLKVRNVGEALCRGVAMIRDESVLVETRVGRALTMSCPVVTIYEHPRERVLFCPVRDANPFFHLFESLWMLAGRRDAVWLDRYVSDFSSRFADEDGLQWGAYGYRWRTFFEMDQIETAITMLRSDPFSRRVVMEMWSPGADLDRESRDLPCNTHIYLNTRRPTVRLDMTVLCRSNDAWLGAYGANAVHMSILHEYICQSLDADMGVYTQFSNDMHMYEQGTIGKTPTESSYYRSLDVQSVRLFESGEKMQFDEDLVDFMRHGARMPTVRTEFFTAVVLPMAHAHENWRAGRREFAAEGLAMLPEIDWLVAGREWMERRL